MSIFHPLDSKVETGKVEVPVLRGKEVGFVTDFVSSDLTLCLTKEEKF